MYIDVHNLKGGKMKTVTFTEFRQHAAACLNAVEQGETFRILRHGKPVADLKPIKTSNAVPSWKRCIEPIMLKGISVSDMIVKERDDYGR